MKHQSHNMPADSRCHRAEQTLDSVQGRCRSWGGVEAPGEKKERMLDSQMLDKLTCRNSEEKRIVGYLQL